MATHRILTTNELNFITRNLKNTKKQLFWLLLIVVALVSITSLAVYTTETSVHIIINVMFGILILLIGALHWVFKGYQKHQLNPIVYQDIGHYKRIYEQQGKYGSYFDTINGTKVKLPWHWRRYLKKQKDQITFEYIIREGAVAFNEHSIYTVSINGVLSLDYELKHGLQKIRPISLLNIIALFLLLPCILIFSFDRNLEDALQIHQLFKNPTKHSISLSNAEELRTISTSNYIKIDSAWVYQYKRMSDFYGEQYILSKPERDRIYNHPSANINYQFFVSSRYITKPGKAKLKEALKNNPLSKNTLLSSADSSIVNSAIEKVYKSRIEDYNLRIKRAKQIETLLEELKPKTFILKIYKDVFNAPKESLYSIKKSLETPYRIEGFYNAEDKKLLSFKQQEARKRDIKNAFILISICSIILIIALFSLLKIIRNSPLKLRLVKEQLSGNTLKRLS